jgi:hypothetical protein
MSLGPGGGESFYGKGWPALNELEAQRSFPTLG